jgi:protease-4
MMQTEFILERERLKYQLNKWKILALVLLFVGLFFASDLLFKKSSSVSVLSAATKYIAHVEISGMILENSTRDAKLKAIKDDENILALVVSVDSPGGTVVGSEKIYNILRDIGSKKPVIVLMDTLAASGGYLISLAADHIIAHNGTITGSIGVIFQTPEITDLAAKIGVKFHQFKSGPLKAAPNPMEKVTSEVEEVIMSSIMDSYDYFVTLVAERRKIPKLEAMKIADGRIYTGRQALKLKLIDQIGEIDDATKWLQQNKKIDEKAKLRDYPLKDDMDFLKELVSSMSAMFKGATSHNRVLLAM